MADIRSGFATWPTSLPGTATTGARSSDVATSAGNTGLVAWLSNADTPPPAGEAWAEIAPGVELEFQPGNDWSVRPWAAYGFNFLSGADDARTTAVGIDADQIQPYRDGELQLSTRISYTHARYQGCTPDDDLGRARVGLE